MPDTTILNGDNVAPSTNGVNASQTTQVNKFPATEKVVVPNGSVREKPDGFEAEVQEPISIHTNDLEIRGIITSACKVANFLNIPFARIPARFRQATIVDPRKERGIIDATTYGPRCPQPLDVLHDLTSYLYEKMSTYSPQSEFSCLNLNIYTPPNAIASGSKLPVLVWIHGGAFTYGDGSCEFDGNFLVHRSMNLGKPIVVVSLNYRLGYFGFLSSQELRDEAQSLGEVGYVNQGLYDQRLGLQWIQKNIHLFGGDGFQVTAAGESAGAFSVLAHSRSNIPLFQGAFMMSCPSAVLQSPADHQATFDRLVAHTGISASAPAGDKLSALRSLTPKEIESLLVGNAMPGWDENFWVDQDPTAPLEGGQFSSWVKTVVIGMTKDENALFSQLWRTMSTTDIVQTMREVFSDPEYAQEVLDAYGVSNQSQHDDAVEALIRYTSDILFSQSTCAIAKKCDSQLVCLYSFDQVDLVGNIFGNQAYHSLDNAFLFHLPAVAGSKAPAPWQVTADAYSKACIDLVNGEVPWEPYRLAGQRMSFDGEKTRLCKDDIFTRWQHLTSTTERKAMYKGGRGLLFAAMEYGMSC